MTRLNGMRPMARRWMLAGSAGVFMIACIKHPSPPVPSGRDVRAELIVEAESNYTFGDERKPLPVDASRIKTPGGILPTITISTASWKGDTAKAPRNRIIFRLTSSGPFPILGLAAGYNYVWRDYVPGGHRTLVVPRNSSYRMMWLRDDSDAAYYRGTSPLPRLVKSALGFGTCDDQCPLGHCTSQDTLASWVLADSATVRPLD